MKLQKQNRLEDALLEFEAAANLVPQDLQYATLRELTRQMVVSDHLKRGNTALADGREIEALGEFRNALHFDPHNGFAQERLNDAVRRTTPDPERSGAKLSLPWRFSPAADPSRECLRGHGDDGRLRG
jgi:tetratricopeptide (TPR) repeat protein